RASCAGRRCEAASALPRDAPWLEVTPPVSEWRPRPGRTLAVPSLTSPAYAWGRRLAVTFLPRDDRVPQDADPLDLALHHVPRPEIERRSVRREARDARDGSGRDHVARGIAECRVVGEDLRDRHAHATRVRNLALLAVDPQRHREVVRVGYLV